jgi:hypothetical protein
MKVPFWVVCNLVMTDITAYGKGFDWQRFVDSPTLPPSAIDRRELRHHLVSMDKTTLSSQDESDIDKLIHALDLKNGDVNSISLLHSVLIMAGIGFVFMVILWFFKYPVVYRKAQKHV